jgi:hypothetical protein
MATHTLACESGPGAGTIAAPSNTAEQQAVQHVEQSLPRAAMVPSRRRFPLPSSTSDRRPAARCAAARATAASTRSSGASSSNSAASTASGRGSISAAHSASNQCRAGRSWSAPASASGRRRLVHRLSHLPTASPRFDSGARRVLHSGSASRKVCPYALRQTRLSSSTTTPRSPARRISRPKP